MQRAFYNLAQAMINHQRSLDAISNNVSNINTAGYKKDQIVTNTFQEELILVENRRKTSGSFVQTYVDVNVTDLEQGSLEYTESPFDIAIHGNVHFNVQAPGGRVLQTRRGQFELDSEGYLCLNGSGRVLSENGEIFIGNDDFIVDNDGNILNTQGEIIDRLMLSYIPADANVEKVGNSLYAYDGDMTIPEGEKYDIIQGAFEKSNVDANEEMTEAMEIQRLYEASSSILKYMDSLNGRAASEIIKL
ncbi:MAG: flagellar hook-basal body protein [Ruminiclostridium sp.]|nr:flagellar hook-basal body protein [Ruminiclostridium sp.]